MSRAVYIGGFGNGKSSANRVGEALSKHFEDVEVFTFSRAYKLSQSETKRSKLARAIGGATLFTHSAGIMTLGRAKPIEVHAFNGPLPSTRAQLLGGTVRETMEMHVPGREKASNVIQYDRSAVGELALHPVRNLKPFLDGSISRFNTLDRLTYTAEEEIPSFASYTNGDRYYQPSEHDSSMAEKYGVKVLNLSGPHDALPLQPEQILPSYLNLTSTQ